MDSFSDFIDNYLVTKAKILREIDEETAYIYYLAEAYQLPEFDLELRKAYHSPIRTENRDDKPSFSVFENTRPNSTYDYRVKYLWKDSGRPQGINSGDIFSLVRILFNYTSDEEVFRQIDEDFGLGLYSNPSSSDNSKRSIKTIGKIIPKDPSYIRVKSKPFTLEGLLFWYKYGINQEILARHKVTQVEYFWTQKNQENPYTPKSLCFAYRIGDKYKLYTPGVLDFKFINDYPEDYVEGIEQLRFISDVLIITKSKKDIMVLDSLGYEAVSAKSETTMITPEIINFFLKVYKRVYILFDNDGKHNYHKYHELYPSIPLIQIPLESGTKDISDFVEKYKKSKTKELFNQLIQ